MADADIYVTKEQQLKAHETLISLDWNEVNGKANLRNSKFEHAAPYVFSEFAYGSVDLHTHIMSKYPNDGIDQWYTRQTERFSYEGVSSSRLNPTALLTHTILHGMRWDQLTPVNWIIDSAMICRLRGDEIDWDAILIFARKHKVLVRLGLGLTYLHEEFQVQIPAKVLGLSLIHI